MTNPATKDQHPPQTTLGELMAPRFASTISSGPTLSSHYVGGYRLGDGPGTFMFHLTGKPSAWHRFWTRVCLGWRWQDAPVSDHPATIITLQRGGMTDD